MLVYGTVASTNPNEADIGEKIAAYDYRAFGEMLELTPPATGKVTENFTGKEHDDEISLDYFGARYLDPMLGMWTSVDPARQFASPYLYAGNGYNPVNVIDPDGTTDIFALDVNNKFKGGYDHIDDGINSVLLKFDNGKKQSFIAPSKDSYFYTENLKGKVFDPNMERKVAILMNEAWHDWPGGILKWASKGKFDFKYRFYTKKGMSEYTVGFLNKTIMTARDAGNAIWGGWARRAYIEIFIPLNLFTPSILLQKNYYHNLGIMKLISNGTALIFDRELEDDASAAMQRWGFDNYVP